MKRPIKLISRLNKSRNGFSIEEILIVIGLLAFTFIVMSALYRFSSKSAKTVSRKNVSLMKLAWVADTIKKKTTSASYLYYPNQDAQPAGIVAGYINADVSAILGLANYSEALYTESFDKIDGSNSGGAKPVEFFYICLSDVTKDNYGVYLYSGELTSLRLTPQITCGTTYQDWPRTTLLTSSEVGPFELTFTRPIVPANQLKVSLLSKNEDIKDWVKWNYTVQTQQPATINTPEYK